MVEVRNVFFDFPLGSEKYRIAVYEWGNPQATETIFCMHGLTRNGRDFDFLARALAENYRVICPDMPGRGGSDALPTPLYNYQTYIALTQILLHHYALTSVHWIGTSMGGIIGMMLAATVPGMIRSFVMNDIGCTISAAGLQRILTYAGTSTTFPTRVAAENEIRARCQPFGVREEAHWQHLYAHGVSELPNGIFRLHYDPAIINGLPMPNPVQDIDLWPFWNALQATPVLLIRGADSDLLTQATAQKMHATHPRLTYVEIPDAGHAPALMDSESIQLITNWMRNI